jgi:hypothetical protein
MSLSQICLSLLSLARSLSSLQAVAAADKAAAEAAATKPSVEKEKEVRAGGTHPAPETEPHPAPPATKPFTQAECCQSVCVKSAQKTAPEEDKAPAPPPSSPPLEPRPTAPPSPVVDQPEPTPEPADKAAAEAAATKPSVEKEKEVRAGGTHPAPETEPHPAPPATKPFTQAECCQSVCVKSAQKTAPEEDKAPAPPPPPPPSDTPPPDDVNVCKMQADGTCKSRLNIRCGDWRDGADSWAAAKQKDYIEKCMAQDCVQSLESGSPGGGPTAAGAIPETPGCRFLDGQGFCYAYNSAQMWCANGGSAAWCNDGGANWAQPPLGTATTRQTGWTPGTFPYRGKSATGSMACACMKQCSCTVGFKKWECRCVDANQKPVGPGSSVPTKIIVDQTKKDECACMCNDQGARRRTLLALNDQGARRRTLLALGSSPTVTLASITTSMLQEQCDCSVCPGLEPRQTAAPPAPEEDKAPAPPPPPPPSDTPPPDDVNVCKMQADGTCKSRLNIRCGDWRDGADSWAAAKQKDYIEKCMAQDCVQSLESGSPGGGPTAAGAIPETPGCRFLDGQGFCYAYNSAQMWCANGGSAAWCNDGGANWAQPPLGTATTRQTGWTPGTFPYRGKSATGSMACACMKQCSCTVGFKKWECRCVDANQKPVGPGSSVPTKIIVDQTKKDECACMCNDQGARRRTLLALGSSPTVTLASITTSMLQEQCDCSVCPGLEPRPTAAPPSVVDQPEPTPEPAEPGQPAPTAKPVLEPEPTPCPAGPPALEVPVEPGFNGAYYYIGKEMQTMPDVTNRNPDAFTKNININFENPAAFAKDVGSNTFPGTFVAATWFGLILIDESGTYTFQTDSMAGSHLWVDGELVIDDGAQPHEAQIKTGTIALSSGYHHVKADWFGNEGQIRMVVSYYGPDTSGETKLLHGYNILPLNPLPAEAHPPAETSQSSSPARVPAEGSSVVHAYNSETGKAFSGPDAEGRYNKDKWEGPTEDPFGFRKKARIWQQQQDAENKKFDEFIKQHENAEYIDAAKRAIEVAKRRSNKVMKGDWQGKLPPLIYRDNHWFKKS